jgi:hypothetical protein
MSPRAGAPLLSSVTIPQRAEPRPRVTARLRATEQSDRLSADAEVSGVSDEEELLLVLALALA